MENEIQKDDAIFKSLQQTIFKDLENSTEKIFNSLVENKESFCASLPESIFVNYFLPFFIGTRNDNPNWLVEWISIAGSPSSYVRIFSDGNISNTLFFVPPVLNTNILNSDISLKAILQTSNDYSLNLPIVGTKFLYEAMHDKSLQLTQNLDNTYIQEWLNIFTRYNLIPTNIEIANNTNSSNLNDLLEY